MRGSHEPRIFLFGVRAFFFEKGSDPCRAPTHCSPPQVESSASQKAWYKMLTQIREKFSGGIAIAILAVIGVSFVFFGANLDFRSSSFAATVDGSEIPAGLPGRY